MWQRGHNIKKDSKQTEKDDTSTSATSNLIDHPRLEELLKKSAQSVELRPTSWLEFSKISNNINQMHKHYNSKIFL